MADSIFLKTMLLFPHGFGSMGFADAGVVKLVDTSDSKSDGCIIRIGSIPIAGNPKPLLP